ncbi:MAG: phosphate uptake regulator PhoU [Candidatus Lokiarchaeota archaeon]|nr:phosphate uptake regulator PhoU [Candidatus Lokiarchaeota archaeon]
MEIRKIQKTGGSSYIVSLPKDWVTGNHLKEQEKVGLIPRADGTLLIVPNIDKEYIKREKELKVDDIINMDFFYRLLVGAYITGYNIIHVTSKERVDTNIKATARKFIRDAIGLEIMEETQQSLSIKDLLNPAEMRFNTWVERLSKLVITQLEDISLAIEKKDEQLTREVIARDAEVKRIHWLILRQHNILQRNLLLSEQLQEGEKQGANFTLITRIIESLGDHAVRMARNNLALIPKEVDRGTLEAILNAGKGAKRIFKTSIDAFFNEDIYLANQNLDAIKKFVITCEKLENEALELDTKAGFHIGYIAESIRRIGEYSGDLAEYIINYLTDKSKF